MGEGRRRRRGRIKLRNRFGALATRVKCVFRRPQNADPQAVFGEYFLHTQPQPDSQMRVPFKAYVVSEIQDSLKTNQNIQRGCCALEKEGE